MLRRIATTTSEYAAGDTTSASLRSSAVVVTLLQSRRAIRSVLPPRPLVTTLIYLDPYGRAVRSKTQETPLSLVRTRDNKFWLQRVLPDGEVVRWAAIGLDRLKHAVNFETYTLNEIDEYGGIIVPHHVMPSTITDAPPYHDAVHLMMQVSGTEKMTRKIRRQYHRKIFAHWKESPDKFFSKWMDMYALPMVLAIWVLVRCFYSVKNQKSFFDMDVYTSDKDKRAAPVSAFQRLIEFSDNHPEQEGYDFRMLTMISPGMSRLSSARAELRESDVTDPHFNSELFWRLRHMRYYGHWPKSITAAD